jgi:2-methylisocitrate lyase-like PEP mutase family enzyme
MLIVGGGLSWPYDPMSCRKERGMTIKTQRFRQLIEAPAILIHPGIYDGFSARLAQQVGFKSAAISGAGPSETNLAGLMSGR